MATTPSNSCSNSSESTCAARSGSVFDLELLDERPGLIIFRVTSLASEVFAAEAGGHRFQRVPPTEKRGRVHSSTITVAVLPEPTAAQVTLRDADLEWTTRRGTGPGGQHRNKTESAVTLKHRPSGLVVRCESERSQKQNKESALAVLRARLFERERAARAGARDAMRRQQVGSGQRGDKRRTVAIQRNEVVDHITGQTWRWRDYRRGEW